ncbi:MAG: acyl-CoA/acyl-ACP dehydrogenase [Firmicutes bacterium]|nr:acyl-CoA/acyl-ACP dehydrogenase [Bacillota bacterium]
MWLTEEQSAILALIDQIAARYPRRYWLQKARAGEFPEELWQALAQAGILGLAIPEQYGGSGLGLQEMALVQERLAEHGIPLLLLVVGPGLSLMILAKHASESMKAQVLPAASRGERVFCFGITEAAAGSNTWRIATTAERQGREWVITGTKHFISGADRADDLLVVARTRPYAADSREGLSLFVVNLKSPGVRLTWEPMHLTAAEHQFQVTLDHVRVPDEALVGEEGAGARYLFDGLNPERINVAALAVGLGRHLLNRAVSYAKERVVFDAPIGARQGIQHPLAEAKIHVELAAAMNRYAAMAYDQQEDAGAWANMAKVGAVDAALEAADIAIQVHGGNAFSEAYDLLSLWELVRLFKTAPVARELALNYVGEHVLGLPKAL